MKVERPGLVVAVAILLSLPMAPGILDGAISATAALLRFLVALLLCWAAFALVGTTLRRYTEQSRRAEVIRMVEEARRRAAERAQAQAQAQAGQDQAAAGTPPGVPGLPGLPPSPTAPGMPGTVGTPGIPG